jgi:hypothetical protein
VPHFTIDLPGNLPTQISSGMVRKTRAIIDIFSKNKQTQKIGYKVKLIANRNTACSNRWMADCEKMQTDKKKYVQESPLLIRCYYRRGEKY